MKNSPQKQTAETFDGYQARYSDTVNRAVKFTGLDVDFFTRVKVDYIEDIATDFFGSTSEVNALDIGCGIGNFHTLLAPKFASLKGIDVSAASIEKARAVHPDVSYKVYDGGILPYDDETFDLAFTICVLHHVPPEDWETFASEMYRVIRPGGLALVFEHNPQNRLTMRAVNNCPFDEDAVLLRSDKCVQLLVNAGFNKVSPHFILSIPPANSILRSVDRWFSKMPFGAQYYVSAKRT